MPLHPEVFNIPAPPQSPELYQEKPIENHSYNHNRYLLPTEPIKLMMGADPYWFKGKNGRIILVNQCPHDEKIRQTLETVLIRYYDSIDTFDSESATSLSGSYPPELAYQAWAPKMYYDDKNDRYVLLISFAEENKNENHRMHLMISKEVHGPFEYVGQIGDPTNDVWAIDMIRFDHAGKQYAAWSGWENATDGFPQLLYIAEVLKDNELGPRQELARPTLEWMKSVEPILEGINPFYIEGKFVGFTFAANASWTTQYSTGMLWYLGGDLLDKASWYLDPIPLLPPGKGRGHGKQMADESNFLVHEKELDKDGWEDRRSIILTLDLEKLKERRIQVLAG